MNPSSSSAVIVSYARTPIGRFRGSLSSITAPLLASHAIRGVLRKVPVGILNEELIPEAFLGNVMSAGIGQAPCRQAVLGAGLPKSIICTTINKVCASGMKSVMLASQRVCLDETGPILLAGGMESMSNVPHYMTNVRKGLPFGHASVIDGILHDGLTDVYSQQHMGTCAEKCATEYHISREEQDQYAMESYQRALNAIQQGIFSQEIEPISIPGPKSSSTTPIIVDQDEEPKRFDAQKMQSLSPAFTKDNGGTVTAANSSSLSDGAAAMMLMSERRAYELDLKPLARIKSFGDAAQEPMNFPTSPSFAISVALKQAKMDLRDIQCHEINEAFAVVVLANMKVLGLQDTSRVNMLGGAIALGHPLGMSGARIIGTLYSALKHSDATVGCASICNGGGGASAIIIERLN